MTSDRLRELDERIAELFREGSPISTPSELPPATPVDPPIIDEAVSETSVTESARGGIAPPMAAHSGEGDHAVRRMATT